MSANSSSPELSDFVRESGEVMSFFISSLLSTVVAAAVDAAVVQNVLKLLIVSYSYNY